MKTKLKQLVMDGPGFDMRSLFCNKVEKGFIYENQHHHLMGSPAEDLISENLKTHPKVYP